MQLPISKLISETSIPSLRCFFQILAVQQLRHELISDYLLHDSSYQLGARQAVFRMRDCR